MELRKEGKMVARGYGKRFNTVILLFNELKKQILAGKFRYKKYWVNKIDTDIRDFYRFCKVPYPKNHKT